jgi:broad specificity phosphatase PhoE
MQESKSKRLRGTVGAVSSAALLFAVSVVPADAMTVTFVRHGESEGNASGLIDTKVPGPPLTDAGWDQADTVGDTLSHNGITYSGVYASTMIRTVQTATPYAADAFHGGNQDAVTVSTDPYHPDTTKDIVVLNGLQEIGAGIFEGSSQDSGIGRIGYIVAPLAWTLGLRFVRIPGGEDGNEFEARVNGALDQVATDTDAANNPNDNALVFSHGATIMFWTMMNVDNPDLSLILTHPLDNTDVVVVESNGDGGWTMKSWAGTEVGPANLPTQLFVNTRDLIVAPQTAIYNLRAPVLALDPEGVATTGVQGVKDVAAATGKFFTNTAEDIGNAVRGLAPAASTDAVTVAKVASKPTGATDLTNGNKVTPGSRIAGALAKNEARVNAAVQDVKDEVSTSIQKATSAIKKVADTAKKEAAASKKQDAA